MDVLDQRILNRATLHRQWLIQRQPATAAEALTHLVGLQGQEPLEPYAGLWSRVVDFEPSELVELLEAREAGRGLMMRRTLHLMTADDFVALRPYFQKMSEQRARGVYRVELEGVDFDEPGAAAEPLFAKRPQILTEAARQLAQRRPHVPCRAQIN